MSGARVLVVEDDLAIRTALITMLEQEGHVVTAVVDGESALQQLEEWSPDLVLLDLMIPLLDGLSVLRWLRRRDRQLPVLILSAKGREDQKVEGLKAGADDYLAKPFGLAELSARVEALLRRSLPEDETLRIGDLEINLGAEHVQRAGVGLDLSKTEWRLLAFFLRHANTVQARERIHLAVWDDPQSSDVRTVDYHVMNLRKKLEVDPSAPSYLLTRVGRGYEWVGESRVD